MQKIELEKLQKRLPFLLRDGRIIASAFVHSSYLNESEGKGLQSNERLEFLGDALLSSVVSHILYTRFPESDEGELTRLRSRLVNRKVLAEISRDLELGKLVLLGKGERLSGGAENDSILANTFESLLAALYIDRGAGEAAGNNDGERSYEDIYSFIESLFAPLIDEVSVGLKHFDYKPALQELTQVRFKAEPRYRVVSAEGPPHKKIFTIEAVVAGTIMGTGRGSRKKDAEQLAAKQALRRLKEDTE